MDEQSSLVKYLQTDVWVVTLVDDLGNTKIFIIEMALTNCDRARRMAQ